MYLNNSLSTTKHTSYLLRLLFSDPQICVIYHWGFSLIRLGMLQKERSQVLINIAHLKITSSLTKVQAYIHYGDMAQMLPLFTSIRTKTTIWMFTSPTLKVALGYNAVFLEAVPTHVFPKHSVWVSPTGVLLCGTMNAEHCKRYTRRELTQYPLWFYTNYWSDMETTCHDKIWMLQKSPDSW